MFDPVLLKESFDGYIGWRQNPDPSGEQLISLTGSTTGQYYNDEHALLTINNLHSIAPDDELYEYNAFDPMKADYLVGDIVDASDELYIRIQADTIPRAVSETEFWKPYSAFDEWLKNKTEAGIIQAINDWFGLKSKMRTAKNLVDTKYAYPFAGDINDTESSQSKIVGHRIITRPSETMFISINRISLQLTQNQSLTIRLFKVGVGGYVEEEQIDYDQNGYVQWVDVDWKLEGGSTYYISYDQDDLVGEAINASDENGIVLRNCKYFKYYGFSIDSEFDFAFDRNGVGIHTQKTFGLNFHYSVECDYTNLIINQKHLFKTVVLKRVAMNLLREMVYNPETNVNRNERNIDDKQLLYEIDGDSQSTPGNNRSLREQYDTALHAIQFDTSSIDKVCLPCRERGVRYRST